MINYTNIGLESENYHGGGLITKLKITANNTNDVKSAIIAAKDMYETISENQDAGSRVTIIGLE